MYVIEYATPGDTGYSWSGDARPTESESWDVISAAAIKVQRVNERLSYRIRDESSGSTWIVVGDDIVTTKSVHLASPCSDPNVVPSS